MASLSEIRRVRSEMQTELKKAHIFAKAVVDYLEKELELKEEAIRQEQRKFSFLKRASLIIKKWILNLKKKNMDFERDQSD